MRRVERGHVGEAFVRKHGQELLDRTILGYEPRAGEHVEGGDAAANVLQLGEPIEGFLPDYVDDPALTSAQAYEVTERVGGIEVKTCWNSLFHTAYPEHTGIDLRFALWSGKQRREPGWLIRMMHPDRFYEPGQEIRSVQPHTLVFLLAEYDNVFASVVFKDIPGLFDRLWTLAGRQGFDLDAVPCGQEAQEWQRDNPLIRDHIWHVSLSDLGDLATVTMIGDRPRMRPDIVVSGEVVCAANTQVRRYEHLLSLAGERRIPQDAEFQDRFIPPAAQQIFADVAHNLTMLETLDEAAYPALAYYRRQRVFDHLRGIMLNMLAHPYPQWKEPEPRFFSIAKGYLENWCKEQQGIPGSAMSWQGSLIFLKDCGLLKAYRPIGTENDPEIARILGGLHRMGARRNITLWSVPRYTPDVLAKANRIADVYKVNRAKLSRMTKADVVRIRGQAQADRLFLDGRKIGAEEAYVHDLYIRLLQERIDQQGYAVPDELIDSVWDITWQEQRFVFYDPFTPPTMEEKAERERQAPYWWARKKMEGRTAQLAGEIGCVYRPVRREDRERLQLPRDFRKWIIVKDDEAP